jgi:hypothetical protein
MGKHQPNFVRMTISIGRDLKTRMDKVKEPVNWSALAARAFEAKLGEVAAKKEKKVMSDVVDRLRASLRSRESKAFKDAYEVGKEWAETEAEADELQRLEAWKQSIDREPSLDWDEYCQGGPRYTYSPGTIMAHEIAGGGDEVDVEGARDSFNDMMPDQAGKLDDGAFVRGFVAGALDIWQEVKNIL